MVNGRATNSIHGIIDPELQNTFVFEFHMYDKI